MNAKQIRVTELDDVDGVAFAGEDGGGHCFQTSDEHLLGTINAKTDTNWDA